MYVKLKMEQTNQKPYMMYQRTRCLLARPDYPEIDRNEGGEESETIA